MFIDSALVEVKAGDGGHGLVSFRREKYIDKGGPNGGDGGHGGSIIFKASNNEHTLSRFRYQRLIEGNTGKDGGNQNRHGASGEKIVILMPTGTQIIDDSTDEVLFDLTTPEQEVVVAEGGKGGFGNAHFKSSVRQAPLVAEKGMPGEHKMLRLELKLIADVAVIGLPNAGKSTFLSVVSNAKPEIADYAFTTLVPNLGVVDYNNDSLLLADIPGLIEGAHLGKGLGHTFLKHVERTKALLHLIDAYQEQPVTAYLTIRKELEKYSDKLSQLPEIVAFTKIEGLGREELEELKATLRPHLAPGSELTFISSQAHEGIDTLIDRLYKMVTTIRGVELDVQYPEIKKARVPVFSLKERERSRDWHVEPKGKHFVVTGDRIEEFAQKTYFEDYHACMRLIDIMRRFGIVHELQRLDYREGQQVIIGDPEIGRLEL